MNLLTNFYLKTIRLRFSIYNIMMSHVLHPTIMDHLQNIYQGIHVGRKMLHSIHIFQPCNPSRCAFCEIYIFSVFIYLSKKNIHLIDMIPIISMSSTKCISKWTCRSMKLLGISFSNTHTISKLLFHLGISHLWIFLEVTHLIY
jgi:hypothetical protein